MKITRETDYAIRCLMFMARDPKKVHSVTELFEPLDIPRSFLAKVLQNLTSAGLLSSTRGATGGFVLVKAPDEITLLDVIAATQGSIVLNDCLVAGKSCSRKNRCSAHPAWKKIQGTIVTELSKYTIMMLSESDGPVSAN